MVMDKSKNLVLHFQQRCANYLKQNESFNLILMCLVNILLNSICTSTSKYISNKLMFLFDIIAGKYALTSLNVIKNLHYL